MDGWIKLHRKIIDWDWWTDSYVVHVFIYLLLMANHKAKNVGSRTIKQGQYLTSIRAISRDLNLNERTVMRALKTLLESETIKVESGRTNGTLITISKYKEYQSVEQNCVVSNTTHDTTQHTTRDTTRNTTKQEYKESKKERSNIVIVENSTKQKAASKKKTAIDIEPLIAELPSAVQDISRMWVDYKRQQFGFSYKNEKSFEIWLKDLYKKSNGDIATMQAIVEQSIANGYQGIFELKKQYHNGNNATGNRSIQERAERIAEFAFAANGL